jgi:hypothetical protein
MNNLREIQISPLCNSALGTTAISKVTSGATSSVVTTLGDVTKLRESFSVSERDVIDAIADQQVVEAKHQMVSKLPSSLLGDSQGESGSVQESTASGSDSDITRAEQAERIMQSILSKPQKKTNFFRMAGVFKGLTSLDDE